MARAASRPKPEEGSGPQTKEVSVTISAPNIQTIEAIIESTSPLVVERFAAKAALMEKMQEGGTAASKRRPRTARDFEKDAQNAKHISEEGWEGFSAAGVRAGLVSACRLVNFKMTLAKLSLFVVADGFSEDGWPLVRIYGKAETFTAHTRNATGVVDIRARPMYRRWGSRIRLSYDADQFRATDVMNLLSRLGTQVGIGAGRPDSKQSAGCGWGNFRIVPSAEEAQVRKKFGIPA